MFASLMFGTLQGRWPVGIKFDGAETSSTFDLDTYDFSELRICIGVFPWQTPTTRFIKARHLMWLEWGRPMWQRFRNGELTLPMPPAHALSLEGSGSLGSLVVVRASELAPFIFPSRKRSLAETLPMYTVRLLPCHGTSNGSYPCTNSGITQKQCSGKLRWLHGMSGDA